MKFDLYDYVGIIVPGTILIVTLGALYPALTPTLQSSISIGDFGLVLILAFLAGHLLQAVGNLWERIVWQFSGGMPTSWVAKPTKRLLTSAQRDRLAVRLGEDFGADCSGLADGRGIMREVIVRVHHSGNPDRTEKFNRNYGLMRGVASGFITSAVLVLLVDHSQWQAALLLIISAGLATYRMVRFGIHYAREAFAEYLNLPASDKAVDKLTNGQGSTT